MSESTSASNWKLIRDRKVRRPLGNFHFRLTLIVIALPRMLLNIFNCESWLKNKYQHYWKSPNYEYFMQIVWNTKIGSFFTQRIVFFYICNSFLNLGFFLRSSRFLKTGFILNKKSRWYWCTFFLSISSWHTTFKRRCMDHETTSKR